MIFFHVILDRCIVYFWKISHKNKTSLSGRQDGGKPGFDVLPSSAPEECDEYSRTDISKRTIGPSSQWLDKKEPSEYGPTFTCWNFRDAYAMQQTGYVLHDRACISLVLQSFVSSELRWNHQVYSFH